MDALATLGDGRFTLHSLLGEGGMARVYRAYDHRLKRWRAVKMLLPEYASRPKVRQRFEAEAQALALLEHPNIVRVYDVGGSESQSWIVMELCEGGSLEDWLVQHGRMPPRLAIDTLMAVCDGMSKAHGEGIVHRDLKPHNVLISARSEPKVGDFGIAHMEEQDLTRTGSAMGTHGFMAPEQREDAKHVDPTCDVYSMGATLFTLITEKTDPHLFAADIEPGKLDLVPELLRPLILRCTAYRPDERIQSMEALRADLAEVRELLPPLPEGTPPLLWRTVPQIEPPIVSSGRMPKTDSGRNTPAEATIELGPPAADRAAPRAPQPSVDVDVASGAPDPFLMFTPGEMPRVASPTTGNVSLRGYDDLYEAPPDKSKEDKWVDTMKGYKPPSRPASERRDPTRGPAEDEQVTPASGLGWAAGEAWHFAMQIAEGLLKAVGNPIGVALPGILIVGGMIGVGMILTALQGAGNLEERRGDFWTSYEDFRTTLWADKALPQELIIAGAEPDLIESSLRRYELARTPEDRRLAAEELAAVMSAEFALLESRGAPGIEVRPSLKGRVTDLQAKRRSVDRAEQAWREAAATNSGRLAIRLRGAPKPPDPR